MDLREALENDEFFLAYQPTIDLSDMSPTGVEALIRWKHPERGVLQPDRLHPAARGDGADHGGRQAGSWSRPAPRAPSGERPGIRSAMAVNVSGRQLDTDQLIDRHRRRALRAAASTPRR